MLFNIFLTELFSTLDDVDIVNFTDENTPYFSEENFYEVIETLEQTPVSLYQWFEKKNLLKCIADKCHFCQSSEKKSINTGTCC